MSSVTNFEKLLESRRNELHLFLRALNKRIVEGSLHTYLTVNHITHAPITLSVPEAQAVLVGMKKDLKAVTSQARTSVVTAVEALAAAAEVPRFEQSVIGVKVRALSEVAETINQVFEQLKAVGAGSDQDVVLEGVIGVESIATTVMGFVAQICTTLVERRDKLMKKGSTSLVTFVTNAFESHSAWIEGMLCPTPVNAPG